VRLPTATFSVPAAQHAKHGSRERELVRERGGGRGIKYGIVGIEYGIEIT